MEKNSENNYGMVGLRPLPRTIEDNKSVHGGSWEGSPTYDKQKGNYPFVADNIDIIKGWLEGDFKTKLMFFEHYWGLSEERDDLDPEKNELISEIYNLFRSKKIEVLPGLPDLINQIYGPKCDLEKIYLRLLVPFPDCIKEIEDTIWKIMFNELINGKGPL